MGRPLPVGVDNFEDMIANQYYYIDKTLFIKDILDLKGAANLFTRPRRFGKTLNLSMLRYFFEDTGNKERNEKNRCLFENLKIMEAGECYTAHMGRYPVINLTLKSAKQGTLAVSLYKLKEELSEECKRHKELLKGAGLTGDEQKLWERLMSGQAGDEEYSGALKTLSRWLFQATGNKAVILIDEYDVPLENSYFRGFYEEMADFVHSLFESGLKTNEYLEFAVITGCLRISKESIFTGLNHLNIISVLDKNYSEHFGFTPHEVKDIMAYYGREERYEDMKRWYDGYTFGDTNIYNPWSVIKFLYDLNADEKAYPRPYWANTSSNDIVKRLVARAGQEEKERIESLLMGDTVNIHVHEEITYEDIEEGEDALWNFLYFTGYLTKSGERMEEDALVLQACIPNREVRSIYRSTILGWFKENIRRHDFHDFYEAMRAGNTEIMTEILNGQLAATISFYDSAENFYHGFLTGILSRSKEYIVKSNRESGEGRSDLLVYSPDISQRAFVLELKTASKYKELDAACDRALRQIEEKHYAEYLEAIGYEDIVFYGIGFFRKNCCVKTGKQIKEDKGGE